jgi:hypothetical protein
MVNGGSRAVSLTRTIGAVLVLVAGASVGSAGMAGAAGDNPSTSRVVVGPLPSIPTTSPEIGTLAPATELQVSVVLQSGDPSGLAQFAQSVSIPGAADFHQFLTPAEVQARFGPRAGALDTVRTWLTSQGLSVGAVTGDGLVVPVSGAASAFESAFATPLNQYALPGGQVGYADAAAPSVPAELGPDVLTVIGLDTLGKPASNESGAPASATAGAVDLSSAPSGGPVPCAAAANNSQGALTADKLANLYSMSPLYKHGDLGQGITVALFEQADYADSNITTFTSCYGINPSITRVPVDGGAGGTQTSEVVLDIEVVAGLVPDANILVYEGNPNTATSAIDTYATILQQDQAQVVSSSWRLQCEPVVGAAQAQAYGYVFQAMAAQGQSMIASSGDQGSESCVDHVGPPGTPASPTYDLSLNALAGQPFVTAAGGTEILNSDPGVQQIWNGTGVDGSGYPAPFSAYPGDQASSGGISDIWPMPSWQVGFDTSGNSSGSPCGAPTGSFCREVPDVSALAGNPRYAVYDSLKCPTGQWCGDGGTSAAAPQWAALTALADENATGHRLGLLNPALYQIDRTTPSAFTDITVGQNNYLAQSGTPNNYTCTYGGQSGQSCYQATVGYDMASGLGTPVGNILVAALDSGYTMAAADGGVFAFGGAGYFGSMAGKPLAQPIIGLARTKDNQGYWLVAADGGVFSFGDAQFYGSMGGTRLNQPIVGIAATPSGQGYWLVAADGGVFSFGDAQFYGSTGGLSLNKPVVGVAGTPSGNGYWLVAADGGVFSFGDAQFYGSTGGLSLNKPVVGVAAAPNGQGYWLVAADGGIFSFGDAQFYGSTGSLSLNKPVVGVATAPSGLGYWLVAADGGVFSFGDAQFYGSTGSLSLTEPVVGVGGSNAP